MDNYHVHLSHFHNNIYAALSKGTGIGILTDLFRLNAGGNYPVEEAEWTTLYLNNSKMETYT